MHVPRLFRTIIFLPGQLQDGERQAGQEARESGNRPALPRASQPLRGLVFSADSPASGSLGAAEDSEQ